MKNNIAVIEINDYHDEVLPSIVHYFTELDWNVDVFTTKGNIRKNAFEYLPRNDSVRLHSFSMLSRLIFDTRFFDSYSLVYFNTVEGFDFAKLSKNIKSPLLITLHNGDTVVDSGRGGGETEGHLKYLVLALREAYLDEGIRCIDCLPVYFGSLPSVERYSHRFIVQGNFALNKKNYYGLIDALAMIDRGDIPPDFGIEFVGRSGNEDSRRYESTIAEKGLTEYLSFRNRRAVTFARFYGELLKGTFILPLIDHSAPIYEEYYTTKLSSSMTLGLGMGLIPVVEESYARLYGVEDFSVTYETGHLSEAVLRALSLDRSDTDARRKEIDRFCRAQNEKAIKSLGGAFAASVPGLAPRFRIFRALKALNFVLFLIYVLVCGLAFGFRPLAVCLAILVALLVTRFIHDLEDFWRYSIKKPLAMLKRKILKR